jgi:hypothetical protein
MTTLAQKSFSESKLRNPNDKSEDKPHQDADNSGTHIALQMDIPQIQHYQDDSAAITSTYMGEMSYYSITLDLIAIYLKGQKIMYIESKTYCEQRLYALMLPAIFVSAVCTVLSVSLKDYPWGSILVSGLTGWNSFILAVITYLKLDAKSEAHKTAGYQFDKLQTICEFNSGKTLLLKTNQLKEKIEAVLEDIEKKVAEIKDINQFVLPEKIRDRYAIIYGCNVFSIVKRYKTHRVLDTQRLITINLLLKDQAFKTSNETKSKPKNVQKFNILTHDEKYDDDGLDLHNATEEQLLAERDRIINNIIEYRKISLRINDAFNEEISKTSQRRRKQVFDFFTLFKT